MKEQTEKEPIPPIILHLVNNMLTEDHVFKRQVFKNRLMDIKSYIDESLVAFDKLKK